jgi:hypothetical protein
LLPLLNVIFTSGDLKALVYGLVREPAYDRGKGYFRRLGAWEMRLLSDTYASMIASLSWDSKVLVDDSMYEEILQANENGIKQYTISLV